jgi:hypothetical protein
MFQLLRGTVWNPINQFNHGILLRMSMFAFDAMALNEHINPKMLVSIDFILQNGVDTFSNGPVN